MSSSDKTILLSFAVNAPCGLFAWFVNSLVQQPTLGAQATMGVIIYLLMAVPVSLTIFLAVSTDKKNNDR
jgi:hypothetical protein